MKRLRNLAIKAGSVLLGVLHVIFTLLFIGLLGATILGFFGTMAADIVDPAYSSGEVVEYANGVVVSTLQPDDRIDKAMPIVLVMFVGCMVSLGLAFGTDSLRWRLQRQLAP